MKSALRNRKLAIGHWRLAIAWLFLALGFCPTLPAADPPRVSEVVVVFKTHFDIGYTDMASNVVARYRTAMIDDALKVVDQNQGLPPEQQFAWTLPGWPLSKIMEDWPGQTPERKQRVQAAFKEGRFVAHGLPFTLHTELLEPEDLVRGLGFSSRLSRDAGLALPRDAKMTDVPCHSWILPTLLKHAGVDFLHLGCNAASSSPKVPRLFWWEGADGSRLLTMYTAESYGTGLVPPADWPYKTWLALIHTGDNHGPPTPDEVKKLLDEAQQKLPGVKVRIGRLSDFADGIIAEKPDLPVVRGDMPDTWIHGPMSDPAGAILARNIRPAIAIAESLNTQEKLWGLKPAEVAPVIARAYEQSLLYGEHTWGGALYWVTKYGGGTKWSYGEAWRVERETNRFARLEASWAEHTAYIEAARDLVTPLLQTEMAALANAVQGSTQRIVVYNPLPWKRDGVIRIPLTARAPRAIKPADGSEVSAGEVLGRELHFSVRDIPAQGYRLFVGAPARAATLDPNKLENKFFKVAFDTKRGVISSLVDKRSGRELVDGAANPGFGQYLYERFDSNQVAGFVKSYVKISADWAVNELGKPAMPPAEKAPYRAASPEDASLLIKSDGRAIQQAVLMFAKNPDVPHGVTTKVTLYDNLPVVDLEITVHDKPADPWPEAGWLCLPFKVDAPQFRVGRQAGIIDPAKDIVPSANRHLLGVNTGVAIHDAQGRGVGVCAVDSPLVSLDSPGCWKYSTNFVPKQARVFVNLFNNQWTTNFRLWNSGIWVYRVRIWPFDKYDAATSLIVPSLEARYPLQAALARQAGGRLPPTQRGLEVSRPGVLVTAFGANPDGAGTLLRLWEQTGVAGACRVRLPDGLKAASAQPVDLRGRPQGPPIPVRNGEFELALKAFAPASLVFAAPN